MSDGSGFRAHGTRRNEVEGRLFISRRRGPFNLELVLSSSGSALEERKRLMETGPWAWICIIEGSALTGPEVFDRLRILNKDPKRGTNRVAVAYVIGPEVEAARLARPLYQSLWEEVGTPVAFFETLDAAKDWANDWVRAAQIEEE